MSAVHSARTAFHDASLERRAESLAQTHLKKFPWQTQNLAFQLTTITTTGLIVGAATNGPDMSASSTQTHQYLEMRTKSCCCDGYFDWARENPRENAFWCAVVIIVLVAIAAILAWRLTYLHAHKCMIPKHVLSINQLLLR